MLAMFNMLKSLKRCCFPEGEAIYHLAKKEAIDPELARKFFSHVVQGEQAEVKEMLEHNPELLLASGDFNDLAGRNFEGVDPEIARLGKNGQRLFQGTAFQYTLLALERMWVILQAYLIKYYPNEVQKQTKLFADDDWIKSQDCNGEAHLQRLIDRLQTYIDGHDSWSKEEREKYWCKKVGAAELLLPMNIFHEICCPKRPFAPEIPNFNCDMPSRSSKFISSDDAEEYDNIFTFFVAGQWARLGIDHALTRASGVPIAVCRDGKPGATHFRTALQALLETRLEQRTMLIQESLAMTYNTDSSGDNTPYNSDTDVEANSLLKQQPKQRRPSFC